jgi:hypothetical protein
MEIHTWGRTKISLKFESAACRRQMFDLIYTTPQACTNILKFGGNTHVGPYENFFEMQM